MTSGEEAAAVVDEEARVIGATTAEIEVETEISETEETTHHHFEATAAESAIWAGVTGKGTASVVDERHQGPEDRHPAEISENANSK